MDVSGFAWPAPDDLTNSTGTDPEDDGFPLQAMMWISVLAQSALCFTGWTTVTSRASEMWQYLWSFGMMYVMTTFLAGVTDDSYVEQWQDARVTSYNILTFGALYAVVPRAVDGLIGQPLEELSPHLRSLTEMATELVAITGGLFAINGDGWFEHDILQHLPIAILGVMHMVNAVLHDRYQSGSGKLPRTDRIGAALSAYVGYSMLKAHQAGEMSQAMCMVAQLCAVHTIYIASVDSVSSAGAALSDKRAIPLVPRLGNDATNGPVAGSAGQDIKDAVEIGFRP